MLDSSAHRIALKALRAVGPSPASFGAKGDGVSDDTTAVNLWLAAVAALTPNLTADGHGMIMAVSSSIVVPAGVVLQNVNFKALAAMGGTGTYVLNTPTGVVFSPKLPWRNVSIDCNALTGVKGFYVYNERRFTIDGFTIFNCCEDACVCDDQSVSGAGSSDFKLMNFYFTATFPKSTAGVNPPTAGCTGLTIYNTDGDYSSGNCEGFSYGVHVTANASNNTFSNVHVWSTYWNLAGDLPMLIGFLIEGETCTFKGCNADSPGMTNPSAAISLTNGGIGFATKTNAINTVLDDCIVEVSSFGDSIPVAKILPFYCGQAANTISNCVVRDFAGGSLAAQWINGYDGTGTATDARTQGVCWFGGNIDQGMAANFNLPNTYYTWTAQLKINGSSTGITSHYAYGQGSFVGGMFTGSISILLTSKGVGTGALTITGLPVRLITFGGDGSYNVAFPIISRQRVGAVDQSALVAKLVANGSQFTIVNDVTDTAVTDTALTDTTMLTIPFCYPAAQIKHS